MRKSQKKMVDSNSEWSNESKIALAKNRRTGQLIYLKFQYLNGLLIPETSQYGSEESSQSNENGVTTL
jgi:hypothetical protein